MNLLGILSWFFTFLAVLLSATLYLFIFAMVASLIGWVLAHYARDATWVVVAKFISGFIFIFWIVILLIAQLTTPT